MTHLRGVSATGSGVPKRSVVWSRLGSPAAAHAHYLVRFESDGDMPETLQIVAISDMARAGATAENDPPPWLFFDGIEQRAKFLAWMNETPADGRPRVVPLRPNPKSPKPAL